MPPYEDDVSGSMSAPQFAFPRLTLVVRRLLILNAVVFAAQFIYWWFGSKPGRGFDYHEFISWVGVNPDRWAGAFPLLPVWQLATYGVLHDVANPMHILINMLLLYFFGTMLEERVGGRRFLITYVLAQIFGGLFYLLPLLFGSNSHLPAIGASGAVYGVLVAVATLSPRQVVYYLIVPIPLKWLAFGLIGLEAYFTLMGFKTGSDGIAHLVHLGGAAYGFIAVRTGLIEKDPVEILERRRAVARVERAADDEERMDRLLDKIHKEGMGSLSRNEKDFLKRMSSRR